MVETPPVTVAPPDEALVLLPYLGWGDVPLVADLRRRVFHRPDPPTPPP